MPPKRQQGYGTSPMDTLVREPSSRTNSPPHQSGQRPTPSDIDQVATAVSDAIAAALFPVLGRLALTSG